MQCVLAIYAARKDAELDPDALVNNALSYINDMLINTACLTLFRILS